MKIYPVLCGVFAAVAAAGGAPPDTPPDVTEFVHRAGPVSYDVASGYGDKDLDKLLAMLKDKDERAWWTNVATAIAFTGKAKAVSPLIKFVKGDPDLPDEISRQDQVFDARKAAVAHLGVIVNRTGDREALQFITKIARADAEVLRGFKWLPKDEAKARTAAEQLAVAAVNGLAVSGKAEAAKTLEALQKSGAGEMEAVQATLPDAIKDNQAFRKKGGLTLSEYFSRGQ
jgi:hypothetical protein